MFNSNFDESEALIVLVEERKRTSETMGLPKPGHYTPVPGHKALECCRGFAQPERHDLVGVQPI